MSLGNRFGNLVKGVANPEQKPEEVPAEGEAAHGAGDWIGGVVKGARDAGQHLTQGAGMAGALINQMLDEYKKVLDVLETFGFTLAKFEVDMTLPPEIRTALHGTLAGIKEGDVRKILDERKDAKLLVPILNAVLIAKQIHERVALKSSGVTFNATLGFPPSVSWKYD